MTSSANQPFDTTTSESDGSTDLSSDYADLSSAHSPHATLLSGTPLATPATGVELLYGALQPFFPPVVENLTKHILSLDSEAIEDIAAILQVTVASTTQSSLTDYENAEVIKASLFARGIAYMDPSGGGVALIFSAAPRSLSGPTPLTRDAYLPGAALGATHAATTYRTSIRAASLPGADEGTMHAVPTHGCLALAPCVHEHTVGGLASKARALLPELPPFLTSESQAPVPPAEVVALLNAIGSHLRDGKVVFAPPMEAALNLLFFVADNFPALITGPVEAVKAELFRAIKLLKLPSFLRGSLLFAVVKELMRRFEDEVLGYLRRLPQLPEIMRERLRLLDDDHVPNAALSISGFIAKPYELWKFAESLKKRKDQSPESAMLSFAAVRDSDAGDPEVAGGELQCYDQFCEKLETAAYRCTLFGVTPSLDEHAHAIALRFICSMTFKDKYKQMALKRVADQFGDAVYKLDSPLPQHNFKAVQEYARRAVAHIASLADQLRSKGAVDASIMNSPPNRAKSATSAVTQDAPVTLPTKDHGLNYPARQAARGRCYYCGSKEHMVRDCTSSTQKCPLCLSNDHHCNQCPLLSAKALQKNV